MKIIRGMYHYSEQSYTGFCVGLIEHHQEKHVWVSFITGEWPGTEQEDCYVTAHVWLTPENRIMRIEDSSSSPFEAEEVFECYPVTRDQVMAVEGAKDWFLNTYLKLFESDKEIGGYLNP
jgi:hypothetical protein